MIKKNIQCKDCKKFDSLFLNKEDIPFCNFCKSLNLRTIYTPLKLAKDEEPVSSTGELSQEYLEENKQVLSEMKKEKMIWNS